MLRVITQRFLVYLFLLNSGCLSLLSPGTSNDHAITIANETLRYNFESVRVITYLSTQREYLQTLSLTHPLAHSLTNSLTHFLALPSRFFHRALLIVHYLQCISYFPLITFCNCSTFPTYFTLIICIRVHSNKVKCTKDNQYWYTAQVNSVCHALWLVNLEGDEQSPFRLRADISSWNFIPFVGLLSEFFFSTSYSACVLSTKAIITSKTWTFQSTPMKCCRTSISCTAAYMTVFQQVTVLNGIILKIWHPGVCWLGI